MAKDQAKGIKPPSEELAPATTSEPSGDGEATCAADPVTAPAIQWAREAGMLPEMLPGPRLRPSIENPKAWLYRAAKLRSGMSDYDQITGEEFNRRIAEVSAVEVR